MVSNNLVPFSDFLGFLGFGVFLQEGECYCLWCSSCQNPVWAVEHSLSSAIWFCYRLFYWKEHHAAGYAFDSYYQVTYYQVHLLQ